MDATLFPAFCTIDQWVKLSGVSRSTTYELLGSRDLQARKLGARVLIDVHAGLAFLSALPPASINMGKQRKAA